MVGAGQADNSLRLRQGRLKADAAAFLGSLRKIRDNCFSAKKLSGCSELRLASYQSKIFFDGCVCISSSLSKRKISQADASWRDNADNRLSFGTSIA